MKIAVPLLGDNVAPRFCEADFFLIAEYHGDTITSLQKTRIEGVDNWILRITELERISVNVLLCSGFNKFYRPMAEKKGMRIITGAIGDAKELVEAFIHGEKLPILSCCASFQRHRFRKRNGNVSKQQRIPSTIGFAGRKD